MSVYSILQGDSSVSAITDEIHIGQAPHSTSAPYIVIEYITILPDNVLDGASGIDNQRISVDCYGTDQKQSIDLYSAARAALEPTKRILITSFYGERDPKLDVYRSQFDLSDWVNR